MTAARTYPGTVIAVHDGDTCTVSLLLWPGLTMQVVARLRGMNSIELKQPGGKEARDHLASLLPVGSPVTFTSFGPDKYGGRTVAAIVTKTGVDVTERMITDGYAATWTGKGPKTVPAWPRPV